MHQVNKPWGYELIWAHTDKYVGKILYISRGESLSLQYHEIKDETIHVLSGELLLFFNGEQIKMLPGESKRIKPGDRHRMSALTDCQILEASTPELDDVIRLEDLYGRVKS